MELQELIAVFTQRKKLFWSIFGGILLIAVLYFLLQSQTYRTTLTLNVARTGVAVQQQEVSEYAYDDFYRLQADERFADTIVRWLESPRLVSDIYDAADLSTQQWSVRQYRGAFTARRLSSQVVDVSYVVAQPTEGRALSDALLTRLNAEAQTLNNNEQRDGWFRVQGDMPVITDNTKSLRAVLSIGALVGFFVALWSVVIVHYAGVQKKTRKK